MKKMSFIFIAVKLFNPQIYVYLCAVSASACMCLFIENICYTCLHVKIYVYRCTVSASALTTNDACNSPSLWFKLGRGKLITFHFFTCIGKVGHTAEKTIAGCIIYATTYDNNANDDDTINDDNDGHDDNDVDDDDGDNHNHNNSDKDRKININDNDNYRNILLRPKLGMLIVRFEIYGFILLQFNLA